MKKSILLISVLALLAASCQTYRSYDPLCPCTIPRNPVTAKDAYYHNYYHSEPIQ